MSLVLASSFLGISFSDEFSDFADFISSTLAEPVGPQLKSCDPLSLGPLDRMESTSDSGISLLDICSLTECS